MDDYPRAFAEDLEESLDHLIELARNLVFSDPFAFENPIDLAPDLSSEQTVQCTAEAVA